MKILALEFSGELRSAAVQADDAEPVQTQDASPRERGPLALVHQVLRVAGLEREEIECVAVGLGPGSYTGIRASIALAQGWELALGARLLGVSSVEALAALAHARGLRGELAVVVDAQRGEFYLARYRAEPTGFELREPLRLVDRSTVLALRDGGALVLGADAVSVSVGATLLRPEASMVARLASAQREFLPGERLEPIYLRASQFVKAPPPRLVPKVQ